MKKALYLLLIILVFTSCEEDVSFNNPAFQARKDNATWRAQDYNAHYTEATNTLTIKVFRGFEKITFNITPVLATNNGSNLVLTDGSFMLNEESSTTATYSSVINGETYSYSTSVENNFNGLIELRNSSNQKSGTVSGTFRFDALIEDDIDGPIKRVSFQDGIFYEIPFTN